MKDERVKKENFPHETNLIFIWFVHIPLPSVKYVHVFVHELNKYVKFYGRQCNKKKHQKILEYEKNVKNDLLKEIF